MNTNDRVFDIIDERCREDLPTNGNERLQEKADTNFP
jgi:hypothetical protein